MRLEDVDKNFKITSDRIPHNTVWYDVKEEPFEVHGLLPAKKGQGYQRIPKVIADNTNEGVAMLNHHTAGGRVRFSTDSPYMAVRLVAPDGDIMHHITMVGQAGLDLYKSDGGEYGYVCSFVPGERNYGFDGYSDLDGKRHTYTINMPLYDRVEELYIGIAPNAYIGKAEPYIPIKPILYYGSSITQGGCASRPGNAYQAMISRKLNADFINLGFSGSARAEDVMIDYLSSLDVSIFVCDYDHNAPDSEHLKNTHSKLYEAYRKKNPDTPIVFVTKPDFRGNEEDIKRREVVLDTYKKALANGDSKVIFVDGAHIFDGEFADSCTVDKTHPNDLGFYRMAVKIGEGVEKALKMLR